MNVTSYYGLVYRGGIALPVGLDATALLMQHNSDIELFERFTPQKAYIWAAQKYVERKNQTERYTRPYLPKMESLINSSYHETNFIEQVPIVRYFSIIANDYVGVFTSVKTACEFLSYFHPTILKEFSNVDDAIWNINWFFLKRTLPLVAYIYDPIHYLTNIQLDKAVPINFLSINNKKTLPDGISITYPELMPPTLPGT